MARRVAALRHDRDLVGRSRRDSYGAGMRWVRSGLVLSLLCSFGVAFGVTPPSVSAAPMTGVTFVSPVRLFDSRVFPSDGSAGTRAIGVPQAPVTATQALVVITIAPGPAGTRGIAMVHDCAVMANPATDVVLPMADGPVVVTNEVYAPLGSGQFCVTTTVATSTLVVDLHGLVDPANSAGAAYIDLPLAFVTTFTGTATIDLANFGVPANATGVAVWLDVTSPTAGFVTIFPCAAPQPLSSQGNWAANDPTTILVAGVPTSGNKLCLFVSDNATVDISLDGYYAPGASPTATSPPQVRYLLQRGPGFVGVPPTRLFDTRDGGSPIAGGQVLRFDLSSAVPIDTTAVVMNVTVTNPAAPGFLSVYPCDGPQPPVSNLNYVAGQTVPNLVTVDVGSTLEVCFFSLMTTHVIADLAGFYRLDGGDGFTPAPPVRLFDTRNSAKLGAGRIFDFDLSTFVAADATTAVFNLTATDVAGPGFVTAFPCGQTPPLASNLNLAAGQTVPNLVTVRMADNKHVCFFTTAATNLLADLAGWYSPSGTSGFISIPPFRWIDTRDVVSFPLPANDIEGLGFDIDFAGATAMVFNATATETNGAGFLTAFPCNSTRPNASNVNFVAGQTVPNMVIAATDGGDVCLFNSAATHWIVDVSGFFTDLPLYFFFFPPGTDNN